MIDKKVLVEEIMSLENPYPKDVFLWDNLEKCESCKHRHKKK